MDVRESWAPKNWCFWTVVLEKTLESPLDCKEIQPVHSKGDQSWVFIGRTDAEAETPILWPPYTKSWLIGKDSDAGRDWGQEEKGTTEDEITGWHHWLNGCIWVNSGSWWWTGRPGVLRFMGSQSRIRLSNWTELNVYTCESRLTKDSRYWLAQRNCFKNKKNQQKLTHGSILICCLTIRKWVLIRICPGGRQQESKGAFCPLEDKTSYLV